MLVSSVVSSFILQFSFILKFYSYFYAAYLHFFQVNFLIRGPHGAGKVYSEMFKDTDRTWKFTYLVVDIVSPPHAKTQLMLESYLPA
jgi:hypothetical protein